MKIFFLAFECEPTADNKHVDLLEGATAHCMVLENNPHSAFSKGRFYVEKDNWHIKSIEIHPIEITVELCSQPNNLKQFNTAQKHGIAIVYAAWATNETDIPEPTRLTLSSSDKFDINSFLKAQKELKNKGRCLHYDNRSRCNEIINAHSIQKNQLLDTVAVDGHVYTVSKNFGDFKDDSSGVPYKKRGIDKVSTFLGFCKRHDNELFEPIDNSRLIPTDQQAFLYAYRSLCRAVFVKENALTLANYTIENYGESNDRNGHKLGTSFAFDSLKRHKFEYDNSLKENQHFDIEYVLFISKQKPFLAFSGLEYPEFDFMGRQLQDLGNHCSKLDLITFCSVPMNNHEWGILFAWHKSSSKTCTVFMSSLATMVYDNHNLGDLLFRFVILNCENIAISPTWWEAISEIHRKQISTRTFEMIDDFSPIKQNYLMHGLEGISEWNFNGVISNVDHYFFKFYF
ncbi:hypothetical protein NP603_20230 [Methylomonas sp. SURF-1]|uniref:Uncharacterized protein n=1 Tax=Methylomonas aurea TaxID=2952224 RepID=A0ABT1UMI4_9GAMM|nr:hypothetical protein [Methylomonas sp. SURF-1]MCQ8183451.1 hypothetical protein [Methylomonas sp. SURF-1]